MEADEAVAKLVAAGRKRETAVRCVGYAVLIQRAGWDGIAEQMPDEAVLGLRTAFAPAGVDPAQIHFPHGPREYLEELVRSSLHPKSVDLARRLIADA